MTLSYNTTLLYEIEMVVIKFSQSQDYLGQRYAIQGKGISF